MQYNPNPYNRLGSPPPMGSLPQQMNGTRTPNYGVQSHIAPQQKLQQSPNNNFHAQQQSVHPQHQQHQQSHSHHHGGSEEEEEFEALKIPADFDEAREHAKARITGPVEKLEPHQRKLCKCCGYQVQRQPLNIMDHGHLDLKFLGSGFPLFYNFIRYCIFILICFICISGIFNIYTNQLGKFCDHPDILSQDDVHRQNINIEEEMNTCHDNFEHIFSIVNKKNVILPDGTSTNTERYLDIQHILNLVVAGVVMIILLFFRRSQRLLDAEIDNKQCTPSDYTIIVKNIPKDLDCDYIKELKHIFTHNVVRDKDGKSIPMHVTKVNLVYDIEHILELEEQLAESVEKKQKWLEENNGYQYVQPGSTKTDPTLDDWNVQIEHIEERIHKMEHSVLQNYRYFTGTAFVSFISEVEKDQVLDQNTHTFTEKVKSYFNKGELADIKEDDLAWENNKLFIEEAPEPDDVDWEFIHKPTKDKIVARIKAWLITIALLILCFLVIKFLTVYQGELIEETYKEIAHGKVSKFEWYSVKSFTFIISMSIVLFNKFVLGFLTHKIVDYEYYSTKTKFNVAFAFKLAIGLFFNSALNAYFVEILGEKNFYGPGGFIKTETWVFIWNCIVPPTVWFIDPWTIQKNMQRSKVLKEVEEGKCYLTQQQANRIMENVEYTQGKRYADIMKTMWFTFFYAPAIPLGLIFSLITLFYYYFVDQYNVMQRRTIKETLSKEVSIEQIENLEFSIVWYAIGNITFSWMLFDNIDPLGWYLLGAAIIYSILPMQEISEFIFPIEKPPEEKQYYQAEIQEFYTDYDRLNPITKKFALKRIDQLQKQDKKQAHQQQQQPQQQQFQQVRPQTNQQAHSLPQQFQGGYQPVGQHSNIRNQQSMPNYPKNQNFYQPQQQRF